MKITFTKMHGAGNDFLVVDDRDLTFPIQKAEWMAQICARRTGVGSDGILLVQPSERADFRMRFINPDGGEVDMCGNGARCIARFAHEIGAAPASMSIETRAGTVRAEMVKDRVRLRMTDPKDWKTGGSLTIGSATLAYDFVNTGVPHVVVPVDNLNTVQVEELGRAIRTHSEFAPAGTNANFVQVTGPNSLRVRTYERGVEAETLACGTGLVASALVMARQGRIRLPATLETRGGDKVEVQADLSKGDGTEVTLTGPAVTVYQGILTYP
ncbi:MAG: diaminopimelate epimerase [Kiritimatiellia bacterium]|nr:diaminopimelate epimerase [Kiritimatiellia bacterium]